MADHLRKRIREKVKALIDDGSSLLSGNVYVSRPHNIADESLPACFVYTLSEESERGSIGGSSRRRLDRTLQVAVEIIAKETDQLDNDVDALAKEVESRMATDVSLGGLAHDCWLARTEITFAGNNGEGGQTQFASCRLTYTVHYATLGTSPDTLR